MLPETNEDAPCAYCGLTRFAIRHTGHYMARIPADHEYKAIAPEPAPAPAHDKRLWVGPFDGQWIPLTRYYDELKERAVEAEDEVRRLETIAEKAEADLASARAEIAIVRKQHACTFDAMRGINCIVCSTFGMEQ